MQEDKPISIAQALAEYKVYLEDTHSPKKAHEIFNQLLTALNRHTLPGWDKKLIPSGRKPTAKEKEKIASFLQNYSVTKLKEAIKVQTAVFKELQVNQNSRYVYGARLEQFIDWVKKQGWLSESNGTKQISSHQTPPIKRGHGQSSTKRLTQRPTKLPFYGLRVHEAWNTPEVAGLVKEVEEFQTYMTATFYPGRSIDEKLKPKTAENWIKCLYLIFGWLVNYKNINPKDLSFALLVPTTSNELKNALQFIRLAKKEVELIEKQKKISEKIALYVDALVCQFIDFSKNQRASKSSRSIHLRLNSILVLARYQYLGQSKVKHYKDISAICKIQERMNDLSKLAENEQPVINQTMKWLNLDEIHKQIVEPLRLECEFKTVSKQLRSITAIAASFQRFIAWGMMTYHPPRRQQEYRLLKFQPNYKLPVNRDEDNIHGYLYKHENGNWYMHITPESYKTGATYGTQNLLIPNRFYSDGKCFYDYLEAFLSGYWRNDKGDWVSALASPEAPSSQYKFYELRKSLNPKVNYNFVLFVKKTGEPYDDTLFSAFFKSTAHRLTGKCITPHTLRDIYGTWFLDKEYTEDKIQSLAYAMGHKPEMLRKVYDKRQKERKHEPIQQVLNETLDQIYNEQLVKAEIDNGTINITQSVLPTPIVQQLNVPDGVDRDLWNMLTPEIKAEYLKRKGFSVTANR